MRRICIQMRNIKLTRTNLQFVNHSSRCHNERMNLIDCFGTNVNKWEDNIKHYISPLTQTEFSISQTEQLLDQSN